MAYYPKPEATAWWDPDEVRAREDDLRSAVDPFFVINEVSPFYSPPSRSEYGPLAALVSALGAALGGPRTHRRPVYVPRDRPDAPTRSCNACVSGKCPMSPRYDLHGRYSGDGRFFDLVDATPYKKVWRCNRCGETFRGISSDNPANLHSC